MACAHRNRFLENKLDAASSCRLDGPLGGVIEAVDAQAATRSGGQAAHPWGRITTQRSSHEGATEAAVQLLDHHSHRAWVLELNELLLPQGELELVPLLVWSQLESRTWLGGSGLRGSGPGGDGCGVHGGSGLEEEGEAEAEAEAEAAGL